MDGEYELIIVNNNPIDSHPRITEYLRTLRASRSEIVKIVEPNQNLGTARGFNAGLRIARSDTPYLVYMSQDAEIFDPLMLHKIDQLMVADCRMGIVHPTSVYEDNDVYNFSASYGIKAFLQMIQYNPPATSTDITDTELHRIFSTVSQRKGILAPLPSFPLTFAVIKRELVERIGSFDDGAGLACHENNDLAYRALLSGYIVGRLNGIFINHRRFIFRNLVLENESDRYELPHSKAIKQSAVWWKKKWGRPYIELYFKWRFGPLLFITMLPYFWIRRIAAHVKSTSERVRLKAHKILISLA